MARPVFSVGVGFARAGLLGIVFVALFGCSGAVKDGSRHNAHLSGEAVAAEPVEEWDFAEDLEKEEAPWPAMSEALPSVLPSVEERGPVRIRPKAAASPPSEAGRAPAWVDDGMPLRPDGTASDTAERPSVRDRFQSLQDYIDNLPQGLVNLKAPKVLELDEEGRVELELRYAVEDASLPPSSSRFWSNDATALVKITPYMAAELTGSAFDIDPDELLEQPVVRSEPTRWVWDIKPKEKGIHSVHLKLYMVVEANGMRCNRFIRPYDHEIEISVGIIDTVKAFAFGNWQYLLSTLIIPPFVYWWKRRKNQAASD